MSEELIAIIEQFTNAPILPESRLKEDLGLDSMQLIHLVTAVEDAFFVMIPDSGFDKLYTVWDITTFLDMGDHH